MELKNELSGRLHLGDIRRIALLADSDKTVFGSLCELAFDDDVRVGYNALWILTHCTTLSQQMTVDREQEIIDRVISESHTGKRRLMLAIVERLSPEYRCDFYDFCLGKAMSRHEAYGVRSLCLKLAYLQAKSYPELLGELKTVIDFISSEPLSPGLSATIRNIQKTS